MELLKNLNKEQGQTFVLVTHSDQVGGMADRIVRMSDGVIVDDGNGINIENSSIEEKG
jgi:ABC-type lipoprotein export system ATPase subunit